MNADWILILSICISVGVPLILFLARNWVVAWISRRVQYGFDAKIEQLRASLRTNEEYLKSALRDQESEISALRSNLLSGTANRQTLIDKRRFEAVEKMWTAINDMSQLKYLSSMMATLNFDAIARDNKNPKLQQFLSMIGSVGPDPKTFKNVARDERPFVPELAWAYFEAYITILTLNFMRFNLLKSGLENPQKLIDEQGSKRVLKAALPHQAQFIDDHDAGAYHYLLDELQSNLLLELKKILDGKDADLIGIQRAQEIMRAVRQANKQAPQEEYSVKNNNI